MTRDELLVHLRGHGNHLAVVKGTTPEDLARGVGLLMLAVEELLRGNSNTAAVQTAQSSPSHPARSRSVRALPLRY